MKIQERRRQVASLVSKSLTQTEIARQLGVDQSTISGDIKALKEMSRQFVFDLVKSDLAFYYDQSLRESNKQRENSGKCMSNGMQSLAILNVL